MTELFTQLLIVAILLVYLSAIDARLTLLLTMLAPLGFFIAWSFHNMARRITRRSQQAVADVNASFQKAVTGITVAKNFRREQGSTRSF